MAARLNRIMVCEGKDDLAALRALLRAEGAIEVKGIKGVPLSLSSLRFEHKDVLLHVESVVGKSKLTERAVLLSEGSASERPDMVAVCFDPDGDSEAKEFAFFKSDFKESALKSRRAGELTSTDGRLSFRINRRDVTVLPAPWRTPSDVAFDGLPTDEHNLERVLISGILDSALAPKLVTWAQDATAQIHALIGKHGWKRAFRIWSAALHPDSESFVDRLMQDPALSPACLAALHRTRTAAALRILLG